MLMHGQVQAEPGMQATPGERQFTPEVERSGRGVDRARSGAGMAEPSSAMPRSTVLHSEHGFCPAKVLLTAVATGDSWLKSMPGVNRSR